MSLRRKLFICAMIMLFVPATLIIILSVLLVGVFAIIDPSVPLTVYGGLSVSNPYIIKFIIIWAAMTILVIVATGLCVSSYLSRTILRPLKSLTEALEHMKKGNLEFEFTGSGDEEIQNLCAQCEALRLRLQKNVRSNLKRESEQKMLLANISHDIKTPITSIKGYVEGIRDGVADTDEKRAHYLDTIYTKAEIIEQMVENLSIYSKLELGRVRYNRVKTDVFGFLARTVDEFSIDLQSADMEVSVDIPHCEVYAMIDEENFRRVLSNIITNAIKYKLQGRGRLEVKGEITENGILLTLRDFGRGISENDLAHVFDGFYRGDPSRNNNIEGNGLGLSICRRIINDHGGKIWLRSNLGKGCEVIILVPEISI